MKSKRKLRVVALVAAAIALTGILASCSSKYATSTSDSTLCVYDGSQRGGEKLKFQVAPGAESKKVGNNDQVITIPASNRFFMATVNRKISADGKSWDFSDSTLKDPLAPNYYTAFAKGNVAVQVQGQVRFKFNLKNACDWYSKHGRRNADSNGDLGFNVRGADALNAGWFKFLSENFGVTMQQVTNERLSAYKWPSLVYDYASNANDAGDVPNGVAPAQATNDQLGADLGKAFTDRLKANLGGDYFCGIDNSSTNACPPMQFQVISVDTVDPTLETGRQKLENEKQALNTNQLEGQLQEQAQAAFLLAEKAKQTALQAEVETAKLQAQKDEAKCLLLASQGLDCDGHRATVIVAGGSSTPGH